MEKVIEGPVSKISLKCFTEALKDLFDIAHGVDFSTVKKNKAFLLADS